MFKSYLTKNKHHLHPSRLFKPAYESTIINKPNEILGSEPKPSQLKNAIKNNDKITFAFQDQLPKLKVPDLQKSLGLYLNTMKPHVSSEQLKTLKADMDYFMLNQGPILQGRLLNYSKNKDNWLQEIWLSKAYLEPRYPTLLNVNWYAQFSDNLSPLKEVPKKGRATKYQIMRASILLHLLLKKNNEINNETYKPTVTKNGPLCMDQFKSVFGTVRMPSVKKDFILSNWPKDENYIILLFKDQIYKIQCYDESNRLLEPIELYKILYKATNHVMCTKKSRLEPKVGLLTTEDRSVWRNAKGKLLEEKFNKKTLDIISKGLLVLCLDDDHPKDDLDISHHTFFHNNNASNRWFDHAIQLIVCNNGLAGVNGEHTPTDAVVPGRIFHEVLSEEKGYVFEEYPNLKDVYGYENIRYLKHLRWKSSHDINVYITSAEKKARESISKIRSIFLTFEDYGAQRIKLMNISPDAYLQVVLQLVYYRMYSKCCHTYETATLRKFLKGRTETTRPCTSESLRFCQAFDNPTVSRHDKLALLGAAVKSHLNYMRLATNGQAFDRHFLGLKAMSENNSLSFLESEHAQKSFSFVLSTSNMTPGTHICGGFAAATSDGYGINYAIDEHRIRLSISSWDSVSTDVREFRKMIRNTLLDVEYFWSQE